MKAQKVVDETRELMRLLGMDERRLHLKWISASEGAIFADEMRNFTQLLKDLGDGTAPAAATA